MKTFDIGLIVIFLVAFVCGFAARAEFGYQARKIAGGMGGIGGIGQGT